MSFEKTHSDSFAARTAIVRRHGGTINGNPCGKTCYPDKKAVNTFLNSFKHNRGRHGRPQWFRPYYCEACSAWHVTKGKPKT